MIKTFLKVLTLFEHKEKRTFYALMVLMIFVALAEIVGISSVLVFLSVLSDPATISDSNALSFFYTTFGFASDYSFQIALSIGVFLLVFLSLVIKAFGAYFMVKFGNEHGYKIGCRLLHSYLHRPYSWFIQNNSAEAAKNVLDEVDALVFRVVTPVLRLIAGSVSSIAIIGFLLFVDPIVSIVSAILLIGTYALIYLRLRKRIYEVGQSLLVTNEERYVVMTEAMGGFKQIKLNGLEDTYVDFYADPARRRANDATLTQILGELPRFALEALTFGILLTVIFMLLLRNDGNLVAIIPTLGIFAFSVMRLLPAIQQMYFSIVSIRSATELLHQIQGELQQTKTQKITANPETAPLSLTTSLELKNVSFNYDASDRPALHNINVTIKAHTKIGIVGGTGAGKTTFVDLILGLLYVSDGSFIIDGIEVTAKNRRAWQKTIGYVPQDIFLTDDTITRNIAFGIADENINIKAVEDAARAAALHDFVMNELPEGYDTTAGERGVRLSGGQRQRIGIARALYNNPSLLVMDEATSALDNITERAVMEAVQNIRSDKTIIMIAHRLTTVQDCDQIIMMEKGTVAAIGTYNELISQNAAFRTMAQPN